MFHLVVAPTRTTQTHRLIRLDPKLLSGSLWSRWLRWGFHERPQATDIRLNGGSEVLNFCANNYLGLANDPRLIEAAKTSLDENGFGMASVRFICGTQHVHKQLETQLAQYLQTEAAILYSSCFDANVGLFETLLDENDAIISDELNHASIIDGIRLCKAKRFRYKNNNMQDLGII